jgi:antitoxin HicB
MTKGARQDTAKDLAYFMGLPYTFTVIPDDGEFFIQVNELPGCMSQGVTAAEALERIREPMALWIETTLADGKPVPEPGLEDQYSGRFMARVPKGLHAALAQAAKREGVSLNLYVASALARVVGFR